MRWKILSFALLIVVLIQCGDDSMNNGNAQATGTPVTTEVFEFHEPEELSAFRFPEGAIGATGYRVTRIEREVEEFRALPFFAEDGQHNLDDEFINTEVIRIVVFK